MPLADVAAALATARPASRWRMEVTERPDGVTIVNDAYNANPDSMAAALRALVAMRTGADGSPRRTWAVLGEMLELGDAARAEHEGVGELAARLGVTHIVAVGAGARGIEAGARAAAAAGEVSWLPDVDTAYDYVQPALPSRRRGAAQVQPRRRATVARRPAERPMGTAEGAT